jgi:hypothetical protein
VGALMVIFKDSLPSAVFSTTTSRGKIFSLAVIEHFFANDHILSFGRFGLFWLD